MAKEYKLWLEIEEYDTEEDEHTSDSTPEALNVLGKFSWEEPPGTVQDIRFNSYKEAHKTRLWLIKQWINKEEPLKCEQCGSENFICLNCDNQVQ